MDNYKSISKWRSFLKEEKSTPIDSPEYRKHTGKKEPKIKVPLALDKQKPDKSFYADVIKQAEKTAGIEPPEEKKPEEKTPEPEKKKEKEKSLSGCNLKRACNCFDSSETTLIADEIQKILNDYFLKTNAGIKLEVTGQCDLPTQKAIMRFQKETNIECDGCVGDETEGKMVELKLIDKKPKPSGYSGGDTIVTSGDAPDISGGGVNSIGSFSSGATISIKASKSGKGPHRALNPNFHGFGKPPSVKDTTDDAYLINGVNFRAAINSADGIAASSGHPHQWGNPVLRDVLVAAAKQVYKNDPSDKGLATLWSVSKKGGGEMGHWGHMSGLEADVSFYQKNSSRTNGYSNGINLKTNQMMASFDMRRNCIFLSAILSSPDVQAVLIEPGMIPLMKAAAEELNKKENFSPKLNLSSPKLLAAYPAIKTKKKKGHNDHYHIRCKFPDNSMTMSDYKKAKKSGTLSKSEQSSITSTTVATTVGPATVSSVKSKLSAIRRGRGNHSVKINKMFKELMKLGLGDIQQMYGAKIGYALGRLEDAEPRIVWNHTRRFYGASSPKTVLGLIQLIKYKGTKRALTRNEVHDLLTYTKKAYRGPDGRGSNAVNRGISGTFRPGSGLDPHKRKGLGKVMPGDDKITGVVDVFDVRNSGFLWGRSSKGGNQQTPRDMFKIFGGLERMYTGKFLNDKEKKFYKQNSQAVNTIYEIQNKRKHSPNIRLSGVTREDHWGKGGRAMHAVSHTFVINRSGRKYVMSVYVDLGNQYGKSQGGDHEGYAVLNTILAKLLERMR